MPYDRETWVDDDGSGTVGTLYSAARMNNIEAGVERNDLDIDHECRHDTASQSAEGTGTLEWTHTPVERAAGVTVLIVQNGTAADQVSAVTYGGVAMSEVSGSPFVQAAGAEDCTLHAFYLGSQVKPGAQTVKITVSGANAKRAVCNTVTSRAGVELTCQALKTGGGESSPAGAVMNSTEYAIRTGSAGVLYGALQGGWDSVAGFKINWGVQDFTHDFGSQVAGWGHAQPEEIFENVGFVRWFSNEGSKPFAWISFIIRPVRNLGPVTELSSSAAKGDTCQFVADAANGIVWDLLYTGENATYPWVKIGGPPLRAGYGPTVTTESETAQTTNSPSVTTPLAMQARVAGGANHTLGSTGGFALGLVYVDGAEQASAFGPASQRASMHIRVPEQLAIASGKVAQFRYRRFTGSGKAEFTGMYIEVDPIRVG